MKLTKVLMSILASSTILAGNIGAPIALPSAKVLPKGVRNVSLKGVIVEGTDRYSGNGEITVLADPFFKSMSFSNSLDGEIDPIKKGEIEAAMIKAGANPDDSFGDTEGQVNLKANVTVPVFAIGVTDNFTAAIAVPILKTSLNVDTAATHNNEALYRKMMGQLALAPTKQAELEAKLSTPVDSKLEEYGYDPLENQDETKLGDIKLVGKYKVFSNKLNALVLGGVIVLPSGRQEDIDRVIDLPGGDGQADLGFSVNYDYMLSSKVTLSYALEHTFQLSDKTEKRVPYYSGSKLTPYKDANVTRDLGDITLLQVATKLNTSGLNLGVGYTFQYKDKDRYSGDKYDDEMYSYIGRNTVQNMHNVTATIGYDTISLFKKKAFPVPLSFTLTHSQTFAGKNVVKDPLTAIDFTVFF